MRQLLTFALILVFAGTAFAADLGNSNGPASIKDDSHVLQNPTMGRDGGDDSGSAVAISGLPFSDTGSTGGSSDAWDEACPYTGSTSPDKWYSFTPATDMSIFVDLCGSLYDTKAYILDAGMGVVACNDDFYFGSDPCGAWVSKIESATLMGGATYYIVVDGYGGDFGDYAIEVGEFTPCVVACDGVAEGEPALVDGYVDNFNGGCNTDPNAGPFQELVADEYGNLTFCGVGGWYLSSDGSQYRDTDWFLATIGSTGTVTWTLESEQNAYGFLLAPQDCANVAVAEQVLASCGNPQVMVITGNPGDVVWLWVGSDVFASPNGLPEFGYRSDFTGLAEGPIATDAASFDGIKAMYR